MEKLGLSYHNIRGLHQKLNEMPEKGGKWKTENLRFKDRPNELFTLRYRDPVEAIKSLWKDSQLSPEMVFASRKIFSDKTCENRIFTEMWTGKWWPALQVKIMLRDCLFISFVNVFSRYFFQKAQQWLLLLSQQIKHNSRNFLATKLPILSILRLEISPEPPVENLPNMHVSSSPTFQSTKLIVLE